MDINDKEKARPLTAARIIIFLIGVVAFGVLMGMRPEFESRWTRSLVAAIAAAILALCILPLRRPKQ